MSPTPQAHRAEERTGSAQEVVRVTVSPTWNWEKVSPQLDRSSAVRIYSSLPMAMGWSERSSSVTWRVRLELTVSSGARPVAGSATAFIRTYQPEPVARVDTLEK